MSCVEDFDQRIWSNFVGVAYNYDDPFCIVFHKKLRILQLTSKVLFRFCNSVNLFVNGAVVACC